MGLTREDVEALGRRVAAQEDAALERLVRPSTDERLAGIHRKETAAWLRRQQAARPLGWRARLAAGKLDEAFAEVQQIGMDGVIEHAQGTELVDLGSAARLARNPNAAVRFYEGARRRFPGSDAAAASAYHLGRMAFDGRGAWAEAARWFAVYLAERPRGSLAPEALGRSMECADKLGDRARAGELASRYLAAYPNGAHAALAKTIAGRTD